MTFNISIFIFYVSVLFSDVLNANTFDLKTKGIGINYIDEDDNKKHVVIKRIDDHKCMNVKGSNPELIWDDDYASKLVPKNCKKTFVTTVGHISPMKINKDIKTYGELEVIKFIKKAEDNNDLILVDSRLSDWFYKLTIPSAVNIPFTHFNPKKQPDEFEDVMDMTNVKIRNGVYDFSDAKTLLLFCNGIWCPQSTWAINNLLKIGYPSSKLIWYRGGMYSWKLLNLTTIVPE
jgi:rhodanese-related sulfurtransferase